MRPIAATIVLLLAATAVADDFAALRQQVLDLGKLTTPPTTRPAQAYTKGAVRTLYYDALPWKGKPTRVFAWLGIPQKSNYAFAEKKMPGVILVHGGGGTAFVEWVGKWNSNGFVALAIAVEGQTDEHEPDGKTWKRHEWAGPARNGIYGDSAEPLTDQWMYHAVADTILANSLLRSLPEVDASNVGVMGTSWGGVITSTVIGIDTRLAFAIPVYGCGHLYDADNQYGKALADNALYKDVWDPMVRMPRATMPVLWLTWLRDVHFPLTSQSACYLAAPGPRMVAVLPDMKHSHAAAWNPPDSYEFARSIVKSGKPWARQTATRVSSQNVEVEFADLAPPAGKAELWTTIEKGFTGSRKWTSTPAVLEVRGGGSAVVHATLPPATTAWFVNVHADLGLGTSTLSSDFMEVKP